MAAFFSLKGTVIIILISSRYWQPESKLYLSVTRPPIKLSTAERACSRGAPRISKHLHLSRIDYFLREPSCQPSSSYLAWGAHLRGCSTPRKREKLLLKNKKISNKMCTAAGGIRRECHLISLRYGCFYWSKLLYLYELGAFFLHRKLFVLSFWQQSAVKRKVREDLKENFPMESCFFFFF